MTPAVSVPHHKRYKVVPNISIAFWGNELIIYHKHSGDTHFFSGVEADILMYCLSVKSFSIDDLYFCSAAFENIQQSTAFLEELVCGLVFIDFINCVN